MSEQHRCYCAMKIVRHDCGCVKILGEPIFLRYCEADYTIGKHDEYGLYLNDSRQCEGQPTEIVGAERYSILRALVQLIHKGKRYDDLRNTLNSFLNIDVL